jgi:4-hydroxy-2-oxovalerate aldolase
MKLLDCTLRDGANVIGKGFDAELTTSMIKGLIASNIKLIEMGNCLGLGAYEANNSKSPLNDAEYLALVQPFLSQAEIGMFMGYKNSSEKNIAIAKASGLHFLRIGANAGDGLDAEAGVRRVKAAGLTCRYSMMKAYILTPKELAKEAQMLEKAGLDEITIMDSAGTMYPHQVTEYVSEMVKAVKIPVGFHGHNNLSLSMANALAAEAAGASVLDCGLLGMARSAGNLSTEVAVAVFQREGKLQDLDMYSLLHYLDRELIPGMAAYDYHPAIKPVDLVYGLAGCHSSFAAIFDSVAKEMKVDLYKLIVEVSKIEQKSPSETLIREIAGTLIN